MDVGSPAVGCLKVLLGRLDYTRMRIPARGNTSPPEVPICVSW